MKKVLMALAIVTLINARASADFISDDFNVNEGRFTSAPNISAQSVGEHTSLSTADRVTTDSPFEGLGHQKITLAHDGSATNLRIRHLSGGGTPANNLSFTTSAGVDGWIGFYAKMTINTGWTIGLNLDDSTAAGAGMDMGTAKPIIADGAWHLYEWNLDDNTQWDAVPSIGGDGTIQDGVHTLDSIYIFANSTGTNGQVRAPLFIDFVAKNDDGSISLLVPAVIPEVSSFAAMGLVGVLSAGAVWMRKRRVSKAAA